MLHLLIIFHGPVDLKLHQATVVVVHLATVLTSLQDALLGHPKSAEILERKVNTSLHTQSQDIVSRPARRHRSSGWAAGLGSRSGGRGSQMAGVRVAGWQYQSPSTLALPHQCVDTDTNTSAQTQRDMS